MATLKLEAVIGIDADACVVVSRLPDGVNSRALRERFRTGDGDSGINQLVMFPKQGTALVEFLTPEGAANVLATEAELQVRGLRSLLPKDEDVTTLPRETSAVNVHVLFDLYTFLLSLPRPRDHIEHGLQSGASRVPEGIDDVGDLNMDADACVVVSGFPGDVNYIMFHIGIRRAKFIRQAVVFPATGTALMEFFTPGLAVNFLEHQNRLFVKTGLRAMNLAHLFPPNEDATTSEGQLSQLKQQLESAKQNLQSVTTENKRLKTSLSRAFALCQRLEQETAELKSQTEADQRKIGRLKQRISASNDNGFSYDMSRSPRGTAVIINNIHFEDMADRDGAEGDTDRLREVFESLGFTVVTFHDLDHHKMVTVMKDQGKADHSNSDCFVCCIMSHGTMGKVYSSDDVGIDICELMKPVNAKKCPSLKGKPKLFFIQACQGEKSQGREGLDGEHDAKPVPFICHEADFFLGLATVPGYVARRDQDGAPYVHHLAKMLADFGPTHDLSAIMAMVCGKMNDINDDKFGWISSNHSTLRKKVVFNAK